MVFSEFEIYKYSIPIEPFTIATGTMHYAQNIFIRAHTDEGITGVGECSAFPMITGETQATCFEMAKDFAEIWKGKDAADIEGRMDELHLYAAGNYTIKSAFDMALYDIAAKYAGQPLYKFLGGDIRSITTDITIGLATPEIMAQKAAHFIKQGAKIIKVKVGKHPDEDILRIRKIRETIGPNIQLRIDANQGWSFDEALYALTSLDKFNIQFCEQPMRRWDDMLLPELCKQSPIPIMADESVFTHYDAKRIIQTHSATYINIKLSKSGGILEALRINNVAEKKGIKCMLGCMLESRLALTANVHFAMANQNIVYFDLDTCLLGQLADPVTGGTSYQGTDMYLTDAIGIGADVDQSYLDKCERVIV